MGRFDKITALFNQYLKFQEIALTKDRYNGEQEKYAEAIYQFNNARLQLKEISEIIISSFKNDTNFKAIIEEYNKIPNVKKEDLNTINFQAKDKLIFSIDSSLTEEEKIEKASISSKNIDEFFNKISNNHKDLELDKKLEEEINKASKSKYVYLIQNNFGDCISILEKYVDEETLGKIENHMNNYVNQMDRPIDYIHEYEDKINSIKEQYPDIKEELEYLNNNVLIKADNTKEINSIPNAITMNLERKINYESFEKMEKGDIFKGCLIKNKSSFYTNEKDEINEKYPEVLNEYKSLKYQISSNTKQVLKNVMKMLTNMKDPDGEPMIDISQIPSEEATKIYGFKNIEKINKRSKELIDSLDKPNVDKEAVKEELKKLKECHEKSIKDYKEIFEEIKKLGLGNSYPGNVDVSRNPIMPEFAIKDFSSASIMNSMYQMLKTVYDSGLTIDEFCEDINLGLDLQAENNKDFNYINDFVSEHSELDLIELLASDIEHEDKIKLKGLIGERTNNIREYGLLSMLESDPKMKEANEFKNALKINYFLQKERQPIQSLKNYFKNDEVDNTKDIIKNILICEDKNKNYMSLSPNMVGLTDPFTGKKVEGFSYNDYLNNHEFNYQELADKLTKYNKAADKEKNQADFVADYSITKEYVQTSIKEIANDLVVTKDLLATTALDDFLALSGKTYSDYKKEKLMYKSDKEFALNVLKESDNVIDERNIIKATNALKQAVNHYNSRSTFSKKFNPFAWFEEKAINEVKKAFTDNHIDETKLENVLNNQTSVKDFVKEYRKEKGLDDDINDIENADFRKSIIVNQAKVNNLDVSNNLKLNNDLNKSIKKENQKSK